MDPAKDIAAFLASLAGVSDSVLEPLARALRLEDLLARWAATPTPPP